MFKHISEIEDPLHFIGIGGYGMSVLAQLALELGFRVQGTDINTSEIIDNLKALGASVWVSHKKEYIRSAKTVIYSSAIKTNNPELLEAIKLDLKILHRSDFLRIVSQNKKLITIAGTHGKTTTSAMTAYILKSMGLDPSMVIGGYFVDSLQYVSKLNGNGQYFVAELDESDGSIIKFNPYISILTNVAYDHMDYFKSFDEIRKIFLSYLLNTASDGYCIVCADNIEAKNLALKVSNQVILYGFNSVSDIKADEYKFDDGKTYFSFKIKDRVYSTYINTIGKHNVLNALGAISVAYVLGLDMELVSKALTSFKGVKRRLNLLYKSDDLLIFDDYAHNPDKIRATIAALKDVYYSFNLYVLFQPHRYSRVKFLYEQFKSAFIGAYIVYVFPVYSAGEIDNLDIDLQNFIKDISQHSKTDAICGEMSLNFISRLIHQIKKPAIILSVGAGDIYKTVWWIKDYLNVQNQEK